MFIRYIKTNLFVPLQMLCCPISASTVDLFSLDSYQICLSNLLAEFTRGVD